jgi:kojibiose phosphorylase
MQQRYGIEGIAQTQVLKQPDVLMLAYLLPELFPGDGLARNYAYYDPRTDHEHGSSLGPAISAVMACRAGEPEVGYQHFLRAARADLVDVRHNAGDGIHGASAGGLWQAVVFGFAGLVVTPDGWHTTPMLPKHWTRVEFGFDHHGVRQRVVVEA